jgi:hypothetical protein
MGCGCKERGEAIARGVRSVAKGEIGRASAEMKFVAKSAAKDATAALRQKTAQIKSRLMRR